MIVRLQRIVYTGWYLKFLDPIFLGIYIVELAIKIYALRQYFFKDGWNWFGQCSRSIVRVHRRPIVKAYTLTYCYYES